MVNRAIIDIGSNSLRLLIYKLNSDSTYKIVDECKRTIRLGSYLTEENYIRDEGIDIALNVLKRFKFICEKNQVGHICVVATEAIRRATNKDYICEKVENEIGCKINILSGKDEGKYGYLAVTNSMVERDAVLLDLGGSSMEITLMRNGEFYDSVSLPLGCIPLTKIFNNIEVEKNKIELNSFIMVKLNEISWLNKNCKLNVIGIGGIAKHIGRVFKGDKNYSVQLLHNCGISKEEISEIYNNFLKIPICERSTFKGLAKKRCDIFAAPLGAILSILEYLASEKFIISSVGLREGIIYEEIICNKSTSRH